MAVVIEKYITSVGGKKTKSANLQPNEMVKISLHIRNGDDFTGYVGVRDQIPNCMKICPGSSVLKINASESRKIDDDIATNGRGFKSLIAGEVRVIEYLAEISDDLKPGSMYFPYSTLWYGSAKDSDDLKISYSSVLIQNPKKRAR